MGRAASAIFAGTPGIKYLVINPYGPGYGVTTYSENLLRHLRGRYDVGLIANPQGLSFADFRDYVRQIVTPDLAAGELAVEVPEARAAGLLLPPGVKIHVRLHGPTVLTRRVTDCLVDRQRASDEFALIRRADVLSSASHALRDALQPLIDVSRAHVYKNLPPRNLRCRAADAKTHDAIFLGRFVALKGADYLAPILARLPPERSVLLIGQGAEQLQLGPGIRCRVERQDRIAGEERFQLLGQSRALMLLSRFENCSMTVLDSLAAGTVVVGWDVGGNAEIAPPPMIRLVPIEDYDQIAAELERVRTERYPTSEMFAAATDALVQDFEQGWRAICEELTNGQATSGPYQGVNYRLAGR